MSSKTGSLKLHDFPGTLWSLLWDSDVRPLMEVWKEEPQPRQFSEAVGGDDRWLIMVNSD